MLPYKRSQRVSHLLKKEISEIISRRVKDPRLGFLTVTDVEISPDLKNAKVYISIFREDEREPTMEALQSSSSFIRSELGRRVKMKNTPFLTFMLDTTPEYGEKMERIFKDLHEREGEHPPAPEADDDGDTDER